MRNVLIPAVIALSIGASFLAVAKAADKKQYPAPPGDEDRR
jgi:hypothetical protein